MPPIVTSSSRRPRRGRPPYLLLVAALAVLAVAAALVLRPSAGNPEVGGGETTDSSLVTRHSSLDPAPTNSPLATPPSASSLDPAAPPADPSLVTPPSNSSLVTRHSSLDPTPAVPPPRHSTNNLVHYDDGQVRHFDNGVENMLERLTRQGARITTIPSLNLSQEEIVEFLRKPVDIYDDDDDETVAAKERTAEFKQEALKFIEAGGTFNQYLRDLAAQANELAGMRQDVHDEALRLADTEGPEACEAYLEKANPELEARGVKPVRFAPKFYEMRARRLARQRELEKSRERESK